MIRIAVEVSVSPAASFPVIGKEMSLLKRLFGQEKQADKPRVRVCVECGMPIAEHKDWCSILRGQIEMKQRGVSVQA